MPARFRVYSDYYSPYSPPKYGPYTNPNPPIKARPSPEEIQKDSLKLEQFLLKEKATAQWGSTRFPGCRFLVTPGGGVANIWLFDDNHPHVTHTLGRDKTGYVDCSSIDADNIGKFVAAAEANFTPSCCYIGYLMRRPN